MWPPKPADIVRGMKELPVSLGGAGRKLLVGRGKTEKTAERVPDNRGRVVPITGPAAGRARPKTAAPSIAAPVRLLPRHPSDPARTPRTALLFGAVVFLAVAVWLIDWMYQSLPTASIGGLVLSPILTILLFAAALWLWREFRAWQSLAQVEELQWDLSRACETVADEERFLAALAKLRAYAREPQLIRFVDGVDPAADVAALREDLDRVGLRVMDKNAAEVIRAGARDVFFLSLVSTNALIEAVIFSVRGLGLIRRVAGAYGCRPGRFGLLRLARHIFTDIALLPVGMLVALEAGREAGSAIRHVAHGAQAAASAAHPLAGVAVGAIGHAVGAVAEGVTPRVAEATLAAARMAHFGLLAAAIVRPVAFSESGYRDMRNGIYRQIVGLRKEVITSSRKRDTVALAEEAGVT
jgi:putative membrane protein